MGRKVVTVEPFIDNIYRIHKAAFRENFQRNITLIQNAISDKANEFKMLWKNEKNIGGQGLDNNLIVTNKQDKYVVETITFDDIIDYLPQQSNEETFNKAILKIDIEGFEPFALSQAAKLFDRLDFQIIFMEWGNLPPQSVLLTDRILQMIHFLNKHDLFAHGDSNQILVNDDWMKWPWDIIWKKKL